MTRDLSTSLRQLTDIPKAPLDDKKRFDIPTEADRTGLWGQFVVLNRFHLPKTSAGACEALQLILNAYGATEVEVQNGYTTNLAPDIDFINKNWDSKGCLLKKCRQELERITNQLAYSSKLREKFFWER